MIRFKNVFEQNRIEFLSDAASFLAGPKFNHLNRCNQYDQKNIAKCLQKLPKNDFTRKMIDFDTFKKLPKNVSDFCQINFC